MALPPREHVPAEQMDSEIRPYFIHHRNQAGINNSLMDLFRLIDLFLREDEGAREPLHALRLVSDYLQRKQIVAPMPAELANFYDDPGTLAEPHDPLAELSQLLGSVTGLCGNHVNNEHQSRGAASTSHTKRRANPNLGHQESVFGFPLGMPSTLRPERLDLALAFGDMPVPNLNHVKVPTTINYPSMAATDHKSALIVEVIREKLRSWLRRPGTNALQKWMLKKYRASPKDDASLHFIPSPRSNATNQWPKDHGSMHRQEVAETCEGSVTSPEITPIAFPCGGIQVTQDVVEYRDSLPATRRRSLSASMSRPLPSVPVHEFVRESSEEAVCVSGTPSNLQGATRLRRNSSAPVYLQSSNPRLTAVPASPAEIPTRSRHVSLKERAISAIFSKKSESSSTDVSLIAHLNAKICQGKWMATGTPASTQQHGPSLQAFEIPRRNQPPQFPKSRTKVGGDSYIPSIVIQPPSISGSPSTATISSPHNGSSSRSMLVHGGDSGNLRNQSTGSRHTTVSTAPHKELGISSKDRKETEKHSGRVSRETLRTIRTRNIPPAGEVSRAMTNHPLRENTPSASAARMTQDGETLSPRQEIDEFQPTPASVHHGLPTPKSTRNREKLPLSSPTVSPGNTPVLPPFELGVNSCTPRLEERSPPPLTSRFSLDSHFTASTESVDGRSASPGSDNQSAYEAASDEGAFLAQLALKRKKTIRSGVSTSSALVGSPHPSYQRIPQDHSLSHVAPGSPAKFNERNVQRSLRVEGSSRSQHAAHRRVLSH